MFKNNKCFFIYSMAGNSIRLYIIPPIGEIPFHDCGHTWQIYPKTPSKFWSFLHKPGSPHGGSEWSVSRSAGVSQIYFSFGAGVWSAQISAQTPWCFRQSIKSISVSCSLGTLAYSPNELPPPHTPLPSLSLCNTSEPVEADSVDFSPKVDCRMFSHCNVP